ncbi:SCO family protein [Lentibacillus halophilus]|uniref:SCO family protein n=1 Tax=Lentibacillus halophilus TaxID=295065 RepID=A0ABN0Z5A6_9BACI
MKQVLLLATFLLLIVIGSACSSEKTISDKLDWDVQKFEATDQKGGALSLADLKGKVWIADFIFTSCTSVCPPMTANMAKLQKRLKEANASVDIVSFSVDPERDTQSIRKKYISARGGDLSNWSFLGGYDFDYVKDLSESSFKSAVEKPPEGSDQFTHGTRFFLVNQQGTIVKQYDGYSDVPYDKIVDHVKILNSKGGE